jgi:hypothetical protein
VEARSSYSKPADAESLGSPDSISRKGRFDILMSSVIEDEERGLVNTCTCQVFDRSELSRADLLNPTKKATCSIAPSNTYGVCMKDHSRFRLDESVGTYT